MRRLGVLRGGSHLRKRARALVGLTIVLTVLLAALVGPEIVPHDPSRKDWTRVLHPPSTGDWFGTDEFGRDVFTRVLYGGRITLTMGMAATLFGALWGISLGSLSGYYGGRIDTALMRSLDVLMAFPGILLAIAIATVLGSGVMNLIVAVGVYAVPIYARITRSLVLSLREQPYVEAARSLGGSNLRIILRHILPNATSALLITTSVTISTSILIAAALSFLGLGPQAGIPEWGVMVSQSRTYMNVAPHLMYFPGLAIVLAAVGFNILGDGLRDIYDRH
jgi:peptide/nickel transport system permease protein